MERKGNRLILIESLKSALFTCGRQTLSFPKPWPSNSANVAFLSRAMPLDT
jgi:hypothetical protein